MAPYSFIAHWFTASGGWITVRPDSTAELFDGEAFLFGHFTADGTFRDETGDTYGMDGLPIE